VTTPEQRGRANRTRGKSFERDAVTALRKIGWPGAEVVPSNGRNDITGAGDIGIECKNEQTWEYLSASVDQAARDAELRDLPTYVVWRKRHGYSDPMEGWCVMRARDFWRERQRMEELEAVEREYDRVLERLAARQGSAL
jgi:hypothetical protein